MGNSYTPPDFATPELRELFRMHQYKRPYNSEDVEAFCAEYLDCIEGMRKDEVGNRIIAIGEAPRVLWSSHTDTVHTTGGKQKLAYGDGYLSLGSKEKDKSNCLGADCTAGVWLMVQMIKRGIPGLYIFHAGEEIGGVGSSHIAEKTPELLNGIDYAIALDRKGTSSVITHQFSRCCSDSFADALAAQLGDEFYKDDGGTFTDTANYTTLVSECTNVSVGYGAAHSDKEFLNVGFLFYLLERLCELDFNSIPAMRDPTVSEYSWGAGGYSNWDAKRWGSSTDKWKTNYTPKPPPYADLEWLCENYPEVASHMLEEMGFTADDFRRVLEDYIPASAI